LVSVLRQPSGRSLAKAGLALSQFLPGVPLRPLEWLTAPAQVQLGLLPLDCLAVIQAAVPLARARAAERTLLRALGASDQMATVLGSIEGASLGVAASAVGVCDGLGLAVLANGRDGMPSTVALRAGAWLVAAGGAGAASAAVAAHRCSARRVRQ
jgi:hypothetical protein